MEFMLPARDVRLESPGVRVDRIIQSKDWDTALPSMAGPVPKRLAEGVIFRTERVA